MYGTRISIAIAITVIGLLTLSAYPVVDLDGMAWHGMAWHGMGWDVVE